MNPIFINSTEMLSLAGEILAQGHTLRFCAGGNSMHPLIQDGDILEVHPWRGEALHIGSVILYRSSANGLIAHRVFRLKRGEQGQVFFTGGYLANSQEVSVVHPEQVLGRVIQLERNGRRWRIDTPWFRFYSALRALFGKSFLSLL